MHEGHHGILEEPKKATNGRQAAHVHGGAHDHQHPHSHGPGHAGAHDHHDRAMHAHDDPISCETCENPAKTRPADLRVKVVAGAVVAVLVVIFLVWRFI
ncbi:MAG: hypothetical protein ACYC41_04245 [Bacillota bacterium]